MTARDDAALRRKTDAPDVSYEPYDPNLEDASRRAMDYSRFRGRDELFETGNAVDAIYDAKVNDKVKLTPRMDKQAARGKLFDTSNAVDKVYDTEDGIRVTRKRTGQTMLKMDKQLSRPSQVLDVVDVVYDVKDGDHKPNVNFSKMKARDDAALRRKTDAPDVSYEPRDDVVRRRAPAFEFGPPVEYSYETDSDSEQ